jgi:phage terminase large subunit
VPQTDVEIGIKKARLVFPRCYFDRANTVRLRECLKRYRRTIPVTTNEPANPLHDEFSHGADAFRYLGMVADKLTDSGKARNQPINYPKRAYA